MPERSERDRGAAAARIRFDGNAVRRILQRAAEEQHRLDKTQFDAYTLDELEEMAAEAGISPAALRAALDADRAGAPVLHDVSASARQRRWTAILDSVLPRDWSPRVKRTVLIGVGSAAVGGFLLAFPAVAAALFWGMAIALVVLAVLVVLGGSPF